MTLGGVSYYSLDKPDPWLEENRRLPYLTFWTEKARRDDQRALSQTECIKTILIEFTTHVSKKVLRFL